MHALVSGKARMAARTLLAGAGGVFTWPGIALTERQGAASVPVGADVARFWISRLHGPEAIDSAVLRCLGIAAQKYLPESMGRYPSQRIVGNNSFTSHYVPLGILTYFLVPAGGVATSRSATATTR
jgi:hypothetical protein